MPRLLIFVPCEKVVVGQDGSLHLISVLESWKVSLVEVPQSVPENAAVAMRWDIFTLWHRLPGDEEKEFVQTCDLIAPSGQIAFTSELSFRMTALTHRNTVNVFGMPISPGDYEVVLYLSEKGAEKDRSRISVYPLRVLA